MVKSYLRCIIGPVMSNRVAVVVPNEKPAIDYEERIRVIEDTRQLLTRLENRLEAKFRAGHRPDERDSGSGRFLSGGLPGSPGGQQPGDPCGRYQPERSL